MAKENFFESAYVLKSDEETIEFYDRWSEIYDLDLNNGSYQQPKRCADALSSLITEPMAKILDVGCGTGLSGIAMHEKGFSNLDGCDLSAGMLEKAAKLSIYHRLFTCNLNEPPLDVTSEAYDALTAVGVFSFGHIMPEAIDELLRILKPKGALIIGLNDHFYEEGSLKAKLENLEQCGRLEIVRREHGEHIPGNDLMGWVLTLRKNS